MNTASVNGIDIFFKEQGGGMPLLLIHGNGCDADVWDGVIDPLAKSFRVIAYDRRCYSRSPAPLMTPSGYFATHADDAASLLRALGATPGVVVGWSGGGLTALHLTLRHPDLVHHLVLVEPPLHAKKHPTAAMMKAFLTLSIKRLLGDKRGAAETFFRWATTYKAGGNAFEKLDASTQQAMLGRCEITVIELDAGTGEELGRDALRSIQCPVTCLAGELTPKAIASATTRLAAIVKQAKVVPIAGAGHMLHIDQPGAFVDAVKQVGQG
jgi:pimeloyl-ACP methyl ester carboxylesterase